MAESRLEFRQPAREGSHPQLPDPAKEVDPLPKMVSSQCQTPFSILLEMTRDQRHCVTEGKVCLATTNL